MLGHEKKKQFSAVKLCYNWDAAECKVVEILLAVVSAEYSLAFIALLDKMPNWPLKSTADPPGKVTRHFFLHRIDIQVRIPVEFTNDQMPTLVKFQSLGSKDNVYLRVTPSERINEQIRSISIPLNWK